MKKFLALFLAAALTLGCAAMPALAADDSYLGVMLGTNVMSLDTNLATDGDSFEVIADCIDGLTQMDKDGAAVPALAESFDLSEDGLTYTFHLRDAKWSNGTPVTANDFVFAWRRIAKEAGEYAYMLDEIGNIKGAAEIISGKESRHSFFRMGASASPRAFGIFRPIHKTSKSPAASPRMVARAGMAARQATVRYGSVRSSKSVEIIRIACSPNSPAAGGQALPRP